MKYSHKKSFDWYSLQQRYSIRKYHFGVASVLLGTALVLGTAANTQAVQADEHHSEVTSSISVDKVEEVTKLAEVSTAKKEMTYAAPMAANPVEVTPVKSEDAKASAEKVEEAKVEKEAVSHQSAVDKSKLLTALSRAEKFELKLYTEDTVKRLQTNIQSAKGLLNKADVTESELSQAESDLQAAVIALEYRGTTTTKIVDKAEVVSKIESTETKNAESKVVEQTSNVEKESVEKDKNALKPVKGLRVEDARANKEGGWNIPLDQEARLQLKSAIEAHAAQSRSRRRKRSIGDLDYTFKKVMTPVNPGHYADAKSVDELTVNPNFTPETEINVWYKDLGYINLVDKNGHYINANGEVVENQEAAIRRQYKNDFNDTTRADVTEIPKAPVGWKISDNQSIRGYNAETKTIDPNDDNDLDAVGKDSNVVIEKENQKAVIRYVSTNGNRVLTTDEVTGKSGEAIAYSTTNQITEFKKQGYKLVSDEFTAGGAKVYDYDTARDQVYTVTLSERVEPVNPDNPSPQPNTPVIPGQPDSPHWPGTVENLDNKESVSRTIHYVYEDGSKAKDDVVETLNFKRWSNVNLVTGHIDFQDWTTNDDTFDKVVSPTIAGYTADKSEIPAVSGVQAKDQDRVETVTYRKDAQKAVIRYVSTNDNRVLTTDEVTGKSGEAIAYSTTNQINEFKKQGYKLVSDEFTAGGAKVYDYDTARDQVYTVTLSERVEPVNPDNPSPQPNTPVIPGQPDSPRWPGTVENLDNKESVSRTIHYVYEDGSKAKDDVVETLNFKRWSNVNLVTGHIDFQDWTTNDDTFDKVVSPTIAGYTADKSEIPAVSGVQAKDQDRVETVTYRKDAQKAVIRYVSTNGNHVLKTDEVTGKSGEAIAYSTTNQINEFKKQGYKLVSDEFTAGGAKIYDYDTARDQVYTVILSERVEPVNPDNPSPQPNTPVNPGQPDSPRWPGTVENLDNKESVSRTIHYVYEDGSKAKDDVVETLNFKRWSNVNLVTGHIDFQDWTTNDDTFDKVVSPTIAGYTADKSEIPAVSGVQAKDQDRVETVTYRKDAQKAVIRYVSTNGNHVLKTDEVTGKSGEAIAYSTTNQINEFKKQGYKLVSDEFTAGGAKIYDYDTARDQVYTVILSERVEPVNPDNPSPQPNTPVTPGQPDSPRWPGTVENLDNKESVSRTIHYVYEDGSKAKDDVVETLNFKRWSNVNLVTGHIDFQDWTTNDDTFDKVVSPTIAGYTADKSEIPAVSGVQAKDQDRVETVTYRKDAQKAVIRYVSTNGNRVLTTDEVTGKSGEAIAYSTTSQIIEFKKQGYKLVSDEFTAGGAKVYDYDTARDQVYTVTLSERVEPVNPDNPSPQPNTPVTPGQPDSPRWPGSVENLDNKESVSRTIHYVYEDGSKAKDDVVETLNFKRWSNVNLVTGHIDFQDWTTNDDTFDKVVSPTIAGYTADKSEIPAVSGVQAKDQDRVETVTYRKDAQKAVIRYVSTNGNRVLTTDEVTGKSGEAIAYSTTSQIIEFKKQGYKLVSDEFTAGGAKVYDYDTARDQVYTVTLSERVEPVNPDNPSPQPNTPVTPGQPDSPRWPGTVENLDNKESVSRTIHYVYEDGSKVKDDVVETLQFKRWSNVNLVTGHIDFQDWTTNDDTFDKVVSPTIAGYTADKSEIPAVSGVQAKDQDRVETVTYRKDAQKAVIRYVSTNGNHVLKTDEVTGKSGEVIAYSTTNQINEFKKQGYKLVSDEFTAGGAKVYDYDTARDQVYTVTLSERVERVTPKDPKPQPNTPVTPGQPNTPNWPGTVERMEKLTQTISRRINFRYLKNGKAAYGSIDQHITYERNALVNLVSGDINYEQWKITAIKNQDVVAPVASQPAISTPSVVNNSESRVARSSRSRRALSEVAPVPENHLAPQVSPVGLTATENGEPSVRSSSRDKRAAVAESTTSNNSEAGSSVNAVFKAVRTPVTPKFYATVNKVGTMEVNPNSPQDTEVNVDLKEMGRIVAVNNKGQYINEQGEVVQNIEDALYKYYDNDPNDATKAAETKIPEAPKFHVLNNTQPTAWGYSIVDKTIEPNDESDPDRIGKDTFVTYNEIIDPVSKETNQTVSFTGAGSATPKDNVQNDFVFKGSYNEATKETTWENKNHTYGTVKVPVVTGYFADKAEAGAKTVTPDLPKATDTVTYKVLGKIIPVDASGNVIVNAPQPQYLNDANDPRKAGKTAVPEILGYKPERTSVTPKNPGEDTKITYVKTDQVAVVRYIDVDNKDEVVHTDNVTGKSGEKIAYTTETVLKPLIEKGYLLQKDGFPTDATFDTDETKVQEYTVLLKHKITVKKDTPKLVERTIHYVFADGTKASEDHHDQVSFSRMLSIDNVTGKTTSTSWVSEDGVTSFDEVVSPSIAGYNPDLAKVDSVQGITAETENQVVTVTYRNVQPIPQVTPIPTPTPTPQVTPIPTPTPTPQVTPTPTPIPTPVPTQTPAPHVPSEVPNQTPVSRENEKELPKTAGPSSGMAQVLGVLGLLAGFSLVGKAKRDE